MTRAHFLLVAACASWALATVTTKFSLEALSPTDVLATELTAGAALAVAIAMLRGSPIAAYWRRGAPLGFLEPALAYALFDYGLARTTASDAALLVSTETLVTVVMARFLLHERLGSRVAVAVALGCAGAVAVSLAGGGGMRSPLGDVLVVAGTTSAAGFTILSRRKTGDVDDVLGATAAQLVAALVFALPLLVFAFSRGSTQVGSADAAHLAAAVATGVLGTTLPFFLFTAAIRALRATEAAVFLNLIPVLGVAAAVVLLGESLRTIQLLGGAVVVLSTVVVARAEEQPA